MPSFDFVQVIKWVVLVGLLVAAVVGLASMAGTLAGRGAEEAAHFNNTLQGHDDPYVPGDGASEMSPQEWAQSFVLGNFGGVWTTLFLVFSTFIVAYLVFVLARYILAALAGG